MSERIASESEGELKQKTNAILRLLNSSKFYSSFLVRKLDEKEKRETVEVPPSDGNEAETEVADASTAAAATAPLPPLFEGTLRDYQLEGVEWLKCLFEHGLSGILADEMGLGKTAQVAALFCHVLSQGCSGPFLVLAPLSLLPTWVAELYKFAPQVPSLVYHGNREMRQQLEKNFVLKTITCPGSDSPMDVFPVLISSYEMPLVDEHFFLRFHWKYIVVDEGHRLKNHNSKLSRTLLKVVADNKLLLTGTPLQNNMTELWALLHFVMPRLFTDAALLEQWLTAGQEGQEELLRREAEGRVISTMHEILRPFILRRLKSDVALHLPPKKHVLIKAPMTPMQKAMYKAIIDGAIEQLLGLKKDEEELPQKRRCTLGPKFYNTDKLSDEELCALQDKENSEGKWNAGGSGNMRSVVRDAEGREWLVRLKTLCPQKQLLRVAQHPYLLKAPLHPGTFELHMANEDVVLLSGKMQWLNALLPRLRDTGHKVLLFSTMTSLLDVVEAWAVLRDFPFVRLDGSTSLSERCERVRIFTCDPECFLFLLSSRAGGQGLNLAAADTVVLLNSDWNPQVDLQAEDRCHRLGQTQPVLVLRFMSEGSIEEALLAQARRKRNLERVILNNGMLKNRRASTAGVTLQELRQLLEASDSDAVVSTDSLSEEKVEEVLDRSV